MNDDGEKFGKKEMRGNKNPAGLAALRDERYVEEMYYSSIQFSIVIPSTRLKCFALFVTIIILLTIDVQAIIRSKSMILKPRCLSLNLSFA